MQVREAIYKKKGRRERQVELYPDLIKECEAARQDLKRGVMYEDQSSQKYKSRIIDLHEKLIHKDAKPAWGKKILHKVLVAFSVCFWTSGCKAPQVEGFTAKIHLKPDAIASLAQDRSENISVMSKVYI